MSYFGLTEMGILKMRSLIHNNNDKNVLQRSYEKELYRYIDNILETDNESLFNTLPRVGDNEQSLIVSLINVYHFAYGDTLNDVVIKECKSKPMEICGPTFMMNLIGNIFLLVQEPKIDLMKSILQNEKELNNKLFQDPPSIRSQNAEFTSIFVSDKLRYNEPFLLFNDLVFKYIDKYFRNKNSKYKFDGLTYTILTQKNQPDLRETMFVYLDVAFYIISFLYDFYKREKSSKTPRSRQQRTSSNLRGGKTRKIKRKTRKIKRKTRKIKRKTRKIKRKTRKHDIKKKRYL